MPIIIELAQGLLRRFAPWIVVAALVLAMAIAGPAACRKLHTEQARARLGEEQARAAFVDSLGSILTIAAIVALAGAVLVVVLLRGVEPPQGHAPAAE